MNRTYVPCDRSRFAKRPFTWTHPGQVRVSCPQTKLYTSDGSKQISYLQAIFRIFFYDNRVHTFLCNRDPRIVRLCVFSIESVMDRRIRAHCRVHRCASQNANTAALVHSTNCTKLVQRGQFRCLLSPTPPTFLTLRARVEYTNGFESSR
jgi:hypothetical protein